MKYEVRTYGDPTLRVRAEPVTEFGGRLRELASLMLDTLRIRQGLGLAAEQIGRTEALCVVNVPAELDKADDGQRENPDLRMPLVLVNPHISVSTGRIVKSEGCLSFPEIYAPIARAAEVTVEFQGLDGAAATLCARGLVARALQHELDHLAGVLIVDRMSAVKKIALAGTLRKLKRKTLAQLQPEPEKKPGPKKG